MSRRRPVWQGAWLWHLRPALVTWSKSCALIAASSTVESLNIVSHVQWSLQSRGGRSKLALLILAGVQGLATWDHGGRREDGQLRGASLRLAADTMHRCIGCLCTVPISVQSNLPFGIALAPIC